MWARGLCVFEQYERDLCPFSGSSLLLPISVNAFFHLTFFCPSLSLQRVVVDGKTVSQLCDENGSLSQAQFQQAMRKQVCKPHPSSYLFLSSNKTP